MSLDWMSPIEFVEPFKVESPIEDRFAQALVDWADTPHFPIKEQVSVTTQSHALGGPYRVDFLLLCFAGDAVWSLIVECDGHDWHNRTKEQAKRDRERDRWFLLGGLRTIRFTGSELHNDARACVEEAIDLLFAPPFGFLPIDEAKDAVHR